tara:strand:- start:49 stop:708 length:660 start_codon:yes stop_codon:yes gene_type:complete
MNEDIINQLYNELLMRDADPTGLASFSGMSSDDIVNTLMSSPEYLIQQQAQKELGRALAPDVGMAYYLSEAQSGVPLDTLLANISNSPEAQAIDNQYAMDDAVFVGNQTMPVEAAEVASYPTQMQLRQITPGLNFLPTNIPTGFFGANDNVAQLYNLGQTPTFRSGVGGYTDMLPSGFEFGIPAQFAQVPIYMRGLFDTGEGDTSESGNDASRMNQFGL